MDWLKRLVSEDNGNPSTIRFGVLFVTCVVLTVWAFLSLKSGIMLDVPLGVTGIVAAWLGGKVLQKSSEQRV